MELLRRLFRFFMGFLNKLLQMIEKIHRGSVSSQLPELGGDIAGIGKKVNDSLFSLYEPVDPNAELVFFHGVIEKACDDMHVRAWMSSNVCWPAVWLQDEKDFPRARILSVNYDSSLRKSSQAGVYSMKILVEALAADLIELGNVGKTGRPVVLVGHDLGGLVIKALCVYLANHISLHTGRRASLDPRITGFEDFLSNVRGIFYFSTPHKGVNFVGGKIRFDGELVRFLELLNSDTANLNDDFEKLRRSREWKTAGLGPLFENPESSLHVCEGSVRPDADTFTMVSESPETINKPDSGQSSSYQTFVSQVKHFVQAEVEEDSDLEFKAFMRDTVGLENVVGDLCRIAFAREVEGRISGLLLHGMGGIGKSTLGQALFLKLSRNFHRHCRFQFDRDAVSQPHRGTTELQDSLLHCLGGCRSPTFGGLGQTKLKNCYKSFKRPILLFIDNIEKEKDLEHIFPGPIGELLQQGSKIIVASRNSRLLSRLRVIGLVNVYLHEVKELDDASANELFCHYAFSSRENGLSLDEVKARHGAWEDVRKVLSTCSGLPLALEVVGAALASEEGTSRSSQRSVNPVLERLTNWLPVDGENQDRLMKSLEFSYSELDEDTKQVFLDIVFCFQRSPWNELWVLYGDRLDMLKRRALIKKETHTASGDNMSFPVIRVHALLAALGERKGRVLGTHIKLDLREDDNIEYEDLSTEKGQGIVKVLVIRGTMPKIASFNSVLRRLILSALKGTQLHIRRFKCLAPLLRILILRDVVIRGTFTSEDTPRNLQCFVCANSSVPFAGGDLSRLNELIHVDIASTIAEHESYNFPRGLQKLRLETPRARGLRFPSDGKGWKLKELGLMSISGFHFRISMSQSLTKLILQGIKGLKNNLPGEMFQLRTLESLSIRYCEYISVIPELQTEHLQYLYFALPNLESLPSSLRNLKHLRSLGLENCSLIEQLPCDVSMLSNPELNCILIGGCPKLKLLPPGFEANQQTTGGSTQGFEVQDTSVYFRRYCTARIPFNSEIMEEAAAAAQMPPLTEQISDGFYKFYEPSPASSANLDIFFFHGLECEGFYSRDAHLFTWRSSGEKEEIWPQEWLPNDFPQARTISVCYDGYMKQTDTGETIDLSLIGENIVQEIEWARQSGCDRPVIFVGHGFGGIVIKKLCIYAQDKQEKSLGRNKMSILLESIKWFYFYATPHLGVHGMEPPAENEGALARCIRILDSDSVRLHVTFSEMWRTRRYHWKISGLGGTESIGQGLQVPEASARFGDSFFTVPADHFTVCRPPNRNSNAYIHLQNLIRDVQRQVQLEEKPLLMVPKLTVGVDALLTEILDKHICNHKFVGFCGMGGVGKTTLSKLIFNQLYTRFEYYCFVEEIKHISGTKDEVKRKIWERMFHHGVPVHSASGSSGGDGWYQVKWRSLFVIFDDVKDTDHVKLLKEIAHENGLAESRFILTSRDMSCLRDCGPEYRIHICRLDSLDYEDANKLFITHALPGQQEPSESFKPVVKQIVDGCEGLPLSLVVLGNYLKGKDIEMWEEIPTALRECGLVASLEEKVWSRLQLSYDRLPGEVKQMFLDIALSFELRDPLSVDDAVMAWKSLFGYAHCRLQILQDRALVSIYYDENGRKQFYMHEHLKRMGQRIARREGRSFDLLQV